MTKQKTRKVFPASQKTKDNSMEKLFTVWLEKMRKLIYFHESDISIYTTYDSWRKNREIIISFHFTIQKWNQQKHFQFNSVFVIAITVPKQLKHQTCLLRHHMVSFKEYCTTGCRIEDFMYYYNTWMPLSSLQVEELKLRSLWRFSEWYWVGRYRNSRKFVGMVVVTRNKWVWGAGKRSYHI